MRIVAACHFFFFQAEDGIRDSSVTGVQTCALPISTGSFRRATRIASLAGQAVGWLLVAGGVAFLLAGNLAGGIWFAFIGWFLVQAARASYQELQVRQMLRGVQSHDVMARSLLRIPPD